MEYPALFEPADEGGFVIRFPDFGWGTTQGDNEQDGREMAEDALLTMIAEHIRQGEPIPEPSHPRGKRFRLIQLSVIAGTKIELYRAFLESGIRKAELARRLGIPKANVDRLFDLKHHSRLDQLEAACAVLGKKLEVSVRDAA